MSESIWDDDLGSGSAHVASRVLWHLRHLQRGHARAILIRHWDNVTLTYWLEGDLQTSADYPREDHATTAAESIRARLVSNGWLDAT